MLKFVYFGVEGVNIFFELVVFFVEAVDVGNDGHASAGGYGGTESGEDVGVVAADQHGGGGGHEEGEARNKGDEREDDEIDEEGDIDDDGDFAREKDGEGFGERGLVGLVHG